MDKIKQRIGWLSKRITLTEQEKELIEFQMKEAVNEVKNNDVVNSLINFGKWYQMDEMQRDEPERWKSIVDRYLGKL